MTYVMGHLERQELAELEDDGMSELLLLKDKIADLATEADNETVKSDNAEGIDPPRGAKEQGTVKRMKESECADNYS